MIYRAIPPKITEVKGDNMKKANNMESEECKCAGDCVAGFIYRVIREYPGITQKEIEDTFGYDTKLVRDVIDGLVASEVIVDDGYVGDPMMYGSSGVIVNKDSHFTAVIIRKRR